MKTAVLLSGSLGMGHDVLAQACVTSLAEAGWSAAVRNGSSYLDDGLALGAILGQEGVPGLG